MEYMRRFMRFNQKPLTMIVPVIVFVANLTFFSSCSKEIDERIKECYNNNDTIINLADLYPEEWDTVYYFTNACNLDEMERRVGPVIRKLYGDVGSRILILNRNQKKKDNSHLNEVVCYKEYFPNYGQKIVGSVFVFRNRQPIVAIPRKKANFLIRKIDDNAFWVIYQENETIQSKTCPHDSF
jgi:hypothetical protein